jgi:uncharacterized protein DUF1998
MRRLTVRTVSPQGTSTNCQAPKAAHELAGVDEPWRRSTARIIQRQASNLRIPELRTLFTIPPRATRLHNLLQVREIRGALIAVGAPSKDQLKNILTNLENGRVVSSTVAAEILAYEWSEIKQAVNDIISPVKSTFHELIDEEFRELRQASVKGFPPIPGPRAKPLFEVNPSLVRRVPLRDLGVLRVTPVSRLQTITVQVGYTRGISSNTAQGPTRVSVAFEDRDRQTWYPGVQFLGEGLFIMCDEEEGWHPSLPPHVATPWQQAQTSVSYPAYLFRTPTRRDELHPVFVWWHTLAHALIRAISIDAGYSSAAIRERVYIEIDTAKQRARGGIILYATQPGSEGSLGGLIALAPSFEHILDRATEMLSSCSNDPLCIDAKFADGRYSGAACYGCLLISETSCEHRNLWLDRHTLLG